MRNIVNITRVNPELVRGAEVLLDAFPGEWRVCKLRQETAGSPHVDTESIILRGPVSLTDHNIVFNDLLSINYPCNPALKAVVNALVQEVLDHVGNFSALGRVMLVKLKPGGRILPHCDEGEYARRHSRYHVVIKADDCLFRCGDESVTLNPGCMYWIYQILEHEVINHAATDRINLIIDVLP